MKAAGLIIRTESPPNSEAPTKALRPAVTSVRSFFVRSHFPVPEVDRKEWRLVVEGEVRKGREFTYEDLERMSKVEIPATLECAGNGRVGFKEHAKGELKWGIGAVGTTRWSGVPLAEVLERVGLLKGASEVVAEGLDVGNVASSPEPLRFSRSLPLVKALARETLVALEMNGKPLPPEHGYPARLVVPGWYGVASVKWLTNIEVIDQPFTGHYQTDKYCYEWDRNGEVVREPVTLQRVRALITEPAPHQQIPCGELTIRGVAWSGAAPIARVEVCVGNAGWHEARLVGERKRHGWQWWELITRVHQPGGLILRARATDLAGRTQPDRAEWNRLGYGNNAIHEVAIHIAS